MEVLYLIGGLFCGFIIYKQGVKDGLAVSNGKEVKVIPNPVKAIKEHKESKVDAKEEEELINNINNLFSYEGFAQKVGEK